MLIKQIMQYGSRNCDEVLLKDVELQELEKKYYKLQGGDRELEDVVSSYMARVVEIAYLQGMKDFAELCVVLKSDTQEILRKYIDV